MSRILETDGQSATQILLIADWLSGGADSTVCLTVSYTGDVEPHHCQPCVVHQSHSPERFYRSTFSLN